MNQLAGRKSILVIALNVSVIFLVVLWLLPTLGLFVSSFRTADQISTSGWWRAPLQVQQNLRVRAASAQAQIERDGMFIIEGKFFEEGVTATVSKWGISSLAIDTYSAGESAELRRGGIISVKADGSYILRNTQPFTGSRGQRVFVTALVPPDLTAENYRFMLLDDENVGGMSRAFFNTLTVTIPSTVIPILVAAFAAYALAWIQFPGRALLVAVIVGLLVVPLQLALIPLLKLHLGIGIGKGYLGIWLAHTGFGMPLAIYLLRNYMVGLPKDIIENARVDGATEIQIFTRIILPLSFPALASFGIFQFLWTWNDLLVAKVFLIDASGETQVLTGQIVELMGTYGGNWEILSTAAFISIAVPLLIFFLMQKYLVRGLLAGSVK